MQKMLVIVLVKRFAKLLMIATKVVLLPILSFKA
jgi:hypothetical protein